MERDGGREGDEDGEGEREGYLGEGTQMCIFIYHLPVSRTYILHACI